MCRWNAAKEEIVNVGHIRVFLTWAYRDIPAASCEACVKGITGPCRSYGKRALKFLDITAVSFSESENDT